MVGSKLGMRMTTLHEETANVGNQLPSPVQDDDEEDYCEYETYQVVKETTLHVKNYIVRCT